MKRIWDISPAVDDNSAVFPGDTRYSQHLHFTYGTQCPVNVQAITLSPHTGAHADAPLHYSAQGQAVGQLDLAPYLGPCRVVHCMDCGPTVEPHHLAAALVNPPGRILVRTSSVASQSWANFTALAPESIALLASKNVALVGIDTPSVDPANSQNLPSHHQLLQLSLIHISEPTRPY